jgi:hypothetical protein
MKTSFLLLFVCLSGAGMLCAQTARSYAVPLKAIISENPPAIVLQWTADTSGIGYTVYRKNSGDQNWGQAVKTLPATATMYTDTTVAVGTAYEYYVQGKYTDAKRMANGYIEAAIKKKAVARKNTILLLVDEAYSDPLATELHTLMSDFLRDGWVPKRINLSPNTPVSVVKAKIQAVYQNSLTTAPLSTLFIVGHLAVPYSGGFVAKEGNIYPPDGHNDHGGAWATDMYYGSFDETIWTDDLVNDTTPARLQNKNIPGDGKFDVMYVGEHPVTLETGRVDFTDLPAFALNHTELTRQYLNKLHTYKTGKTPVYRAGLIDDNFGAADGEAFASAAWNDFTTFFGDSVFEKDYVTETRVHPYLFTYGSGFGNYSTCFGVVNTNQFANDSLQHLFTLLFGSYFGDWDSQNNLLRAALASKTGGLASAWSGRPYWRLHHMSLGGTIGFSTRLTQNNYWNTAEPSGYAHNSYPTAVNINLMGDPTLRLHMREPMLPIKASAAADSIFVTLHWPTIPGVSGYEVSKTSSLDNGFLARISIAAGDTFWTDEHPYTGYSKYMVRPIYLENTPSGSYYNMGLGAIDSAYSKNTVGITEVKQNNPLHVAVYPNPTNGQFTLLFNSPTAASIDITGTEGRSVYNTTGTYEKIDLDGLAKGCYFVRIRTETTQIVKKLIIH